MVALASNSDDFKPKRRKIDAQAVREMARLISKRITETGACHMLGIRPETWFNWKLKQKNSKKFGDVLECARETKLEAIIETIDEAGNPYEVVTKSGTAFMRPGDWRAKAWIAERVLAPERFADRRNETTVNQTAITVNLGGDEALKRLVSMYAEQSKSMQVSGEQSIKSLPESANVTHKQVIDIQ